MIYIILAMVFYTVIILTGTAASRHLNTNLVAAITNVISAIVPFIVVIPILSKKIFTASKFGVGMALIDGFFIALFAMALTKSFSLNKIGIVTPIVFGGAILMSTIGSYFIFKEKISLTEAIGLFLVLAGLSVVIYARAVAV